VQIQQNQGIEVAVLSVKRDGRTEEFGAASVFTFPPSFPARFGNSSGAIEWLREHARSFNLVIVSEVWSVMIQRAMLTLRTLGVPYIIQPRGSLDPYDLRKKAFLKQILGRLVVRKNLEAARCILTASSAENDRLQTFGGKVTRKTLPHPVRANPVGDGSRLRDKLGLPKETLLFLFLSRIDPKKRVDLLIEAFHRAAGQLPPCKLLIAGDGHAPLLLQLKEQAKALSCAENILFLGFQGGKDKDDLLAAADIFVLPSDFENFGIAVVEALHAGLPVVLSRGVQLWQGIEAAGAGLVFPEKVEELAEILILVGNDPHLRETLSNAALTYAAGFSPEALTPEYMAFWSSAATS
jgi:glycosyltransferase involved in cell wall biosynthesis